MTIRVAIGAGLIGMSFISQNARADDWSGIYVGGHAGYSFASVDVAQTEIPLPGALPTTFRDFSDNPSGFSGGFQIGAQKQFGTFLLGIEGSYTALDIDDFGYTELNNGVSARTAEISDMFAIAARGGLAFGNTLAYGKLGYANAGVGYNNVLNATGATLADTDSRENGLLLGAGMEFAVSENITVGVDYTYVNFDIDTRIQDLELAGLQADIQEKVDSDIHRIGVTLNFKFNGF